MVSWIHLSLGAIEIVVSLALAFYCFRLINKFFKGGIFEASFKAFMATGVITAVALVFDIVADAVEFESLNLHFLHLVAEILAVVTLLYGVHQLYKAWIKLGQQ